MLSLLALVLLPLSIVRAATVYAVADNGEGGNFFGSLDIATGQFTKIADTTPFFYSITAGPGGVLYGADVNSGKLFTITTAGVTAPFGSVVAPAAFYGLAYSEATGGFYADTLKTMAAELYSIPANGSSDSDVEQLAAPGAGLFSTGNLAFGPEQKLYFNYSSDKKNATNSKLYLIDPSAGTEKVVGSGLGTSLLVLLSDGKTLYGIDTTSDDMGIYTIDTSSGVATRVSTVKGLPGDSGYYIYAATALIAPLPTVTVSTTNTMLVEGGPKRKIVFKRSDGDTTAGLTVQYKLSGAAINGKDYGTADGKMLGNSITIPAGASKADLAVFALANGTTEGRKKLVLKLAASPKGAYTIGSPNEVKLSITDRP